MRLLTWNCCGGPFSKKIPLLTSLAPDIAVLPECPKPETECDTRLWFGENRHKGIAVLTSPRYRIRALSLEPNVPKFAFPLEVTGPVNFRLLVIWSKGKQPYRYVMGIVKAIQMYRHVIEGLPTVVIGDFNSNAIWDSWHSPDLNHSALVKLLGDLGLVSSYHYFYGETYGAETRPTFYLHKNVARSYHIDYCFVPEAWASHIQSVQIGSDDKWQKYGDHRPLLVHLNLSEQQDAQVTH